MSTFPSAPDDETLVDGIHLSILAQPNDTTCGPTCLQAVYGYYGDVVSLDQVISETPALVDGGTLAPMLGQHAIRRNYQAVIYTFNLRVFDPTWFDADGNAITDLSQKLQAQLDVKHDDKLRLAGDAYRNFILSGGTIRMVDLTREILRRYLSRGIPILTGLSSTFLYRSAREIGATCEPDDIRGTPVGHFVVLCGYDRKRKLVQVADPYLPNPVAPRENYYVIGVDRVVSAVLLGTLTYDANLLILTPRK
ncbi:MAG: C39 family peptidase [Planctomycetaceae bacterium]